MTLLGFFEYLCHESTAYRNILILSVRDRLYTSESDPVEIVSRYRDPQLQVGECFNAHFIPNNCYLTC